MLTSGFLQATPVGWVAHRLGLAESTRENASDPLELISNGDRDITEFFIGAGSPIRDLRIVGLQLPPNALVLLVDRNGTYIIPRGSTNLQAGDRVLVFAAKPERQPAEQVLGAA